jgi:hypothetical protein
MLNMSPFHREHEKFYSVSPREQAVVLQRHSRTLHARADRWMTTPPDHPEAFSAYQGAPDLNAAAALQLDGVLFMEGEGEPGEIGHLKRDLWVFADDASEAGEWLANAMQSSSDIATVELNVGVLALPFRSEARVGNHSGDRDGVGLGNTGTGTTPRMAAS